MLRERNEPVELPNRNPQGINPALLTFEEYHKLINDKDKRHYDSAYSISLKKMNSYNDKTHYHKLYRRIKIHNITFEIWLQGADNSDFGGNTDEWGIGVFTGNTKVAAVQDEWGCLLVIVANEYRGFGLGPILVKLARTIEPNRPSGGFTPSGYKNFVKVYQAMVREALATGLYHTLVTQGKITMQRVKTIIASAGLPKQELKPSRDLNSDDPKSWLLYVGEHGDFVFYDRKLKELLAEGGTQNDYWIDKMIKGYAYVQIHNGHSDNWAMLRQFGADTAKIKTFLINCAVQLSNVEDVSLYLEPAEIDFIDKRMIDRVEEAGMVRGFKSYKVIPTGETFDYSPFGELERRWRKSFDRYDEFCIQMRELAHSKYQPEEPARPGYNGMVYGT